MGGTAKVTMGGETKVTCRAIAHPSKDVCGKPAECLVTFGDGDKVHACGSCTLLLQQTAEEHGTRLKVELIK